MVNFWVCLNKYIKEVGALTSKFNWLTDEHTFLLLLDKWSLIDLYNILFGYCFSITAYTSFCYFSHFQITLDVALLWTIVTLPCKQGFCLVRRAQFWKRTMLNSTFSASLHEVKECWHNIPEVLWEIKMVMTREWKQLVRKKDKRMRDCFAEVASKSWTHN